MKKILISLKKQYKNIETLIEKRELVYDRRSEKWKESDNGLIYESDTLELDCVKDNIEDAIKSLQEITGYYN